MNNLKREIKKKEEKLENLEIKPGYAMKQLMIKMKGDIVNVLPSNVDFDKFQKCAIHVYNADEELQSCEVMTFIAAMIECSRLGLEPNSALGQAYLVPTKVDGVDKVEVQIGYKGMIELAYRSGKIKSIYTNEVRSNDEFYIDYGLDQKLVHRPFLGEDRGDVIGYYAVYHLESRGSSFLFMTVSEVKAHSKKYLKSFNNSLWDSEFDAMARKTVIKRLLKYAPLSVEVQQTFSKDELVGGGYGWKDGYSTILH